MKLSGTDLLPGDVVSIGRSSGQNGEEKSVPADMLILAGSAIVNEAILTGESTPQWKVFLFSGTHANVVCVCLFIGLDVNAFFPQSNNLAQLEKLSWKAKYVS